MSTDLRNLSISELKRIKRDIQKQLKDDYNKKQKLIADINKLEKLREKINPKPKIKTFNEYFQECIKNKTIPPDTPSYLRKALEKTLKEYDQGIIKEKSALEEFANKYIIKGEPGITPFEFFRNKASSLKDFLRNRRNIKVRFVLVCLMEKMDGNQKLIITVQDKAYFHSDTHINLESTDVKEILAKVIHNILEKISIYQQNGSGWYFKEVLHLEIHTVVYKPVGGSSYIPLPDWIMLKKAIVNIRNTDEKCFLWCVLTIDIFTQERRMI